MSTILYEQASRIIEAVIAQVEQLPTNRRAVAAVVDSHGDLIAFARMDGAPLSSINIAMNKAYTAARSEKTTQKIGKDVRHPETGFDIRYFSDPRFVGWGGGVPVRRDGKVVGAIGVSGLVEDDDVRLATWAAEQLAISS